ncbi:hypothetical protein [Cellvibrio sp. UBA7671]|uniref:hypothetical protein n=1 Tax=Cellvibrio sp. UBA7671 TaxID=1946312 RepID=UPI002F3558E1
MTVTSNKWCARTFFIVSAFLFAGAGVQAQPISAYLYGQNHWLADGDEGRVGYIHNLWPQVKASGVKTVRIGGNGYERNFPSRNQLNKMVDNIKSIGAEPLLQIPRHFSDEATKELVAYYTRKGNRQIKFWSIGNEPMLHEEYTIEEIHQYLVRIAKAMRRAGPDIKIFMFDEAWLRIPEYSALVGGRLDVVGLKENGRWLIDGVNFHSYPNGPKFVRDDVVFTGPKKILDQVLELQRLIKNANAKYQRKGDAALLWGLTEFNVTYHNPDREVSGYGNTSFLAGQFTAEIFGYGMQYSAYMLNPWCINESDAVATDFGYLGLPREFYPRSSYYHMQLLSTYLLGEFIASSDNQAYVKTIATRDAGTIAIMIMNQHQTDTFEFSLSFSKSSAGVKSPLQINIAANLDKTFSSHIAAQSTRVYVFDRNGSLQKTISYSLQDNMVFKAPQVE